MINPKVSYIVASYNHEKYIEALILSVLNQEFSDLELIVVDDGSTDHSVEIITHIAQQDQRIKIFTQENHGVVHARNRGISYARGEFVSIIDSDDLLPLNRTTLQVKALEANPKAVMVYGNAWLIDDIGLCQRTFFDYYPPATGYFSVELFATYCFVPAISVMFRRSAFDITGPFWGPGPNADYLKWIEIGLLGEVICLFDEKLGCWRIHENNTFAPSTEKRCQLYENLRIALQELIRKYPELEQNLGKRRINKRFASCHFMAGVYASIEQEWSLARKHYRQAIDFYPSLQNWVAYVSTNLLFSYISKYLYKFASRKIL